MRIEGSDNRSATLDFRGGLGAPDNFMMACVHAIEKPNREMHWTRLCREISDGMEDFQREGKKRLAFFSGLSTLSLMGMALLCRRCLALWLRR